MIRRYFVSLHDVLDALTEREKETLRLLLGGYWGGDITAIRSNR